MIDIRLGPGQHALVGHGSRLCVASMERTLGHTYSGPWHVVRVRGWRRGWDVQMPTSAWRYHDGTRVVAPERVVYLNVRPDPNERINCALFVISAEEMTAFDLREWVCSRVRVNSVLEKVRIIGGTAWMYVARDEFVWRRPSRPPEAIIRRTYVDTLDRAHAELGDEFQREYDAMTDGVSMHLVVDDIPG